METWSGGGGRGVKRGEQAALPPGLFSGSVTPPGGTAWPRSQRPLNLDSKKYGFSVFRSLGQTNRAIKIEKAQLFEESNFTTHNPQFYDSPGDSALAPWNMHVANFLIEIGIQKPLTYPLKVHTQSLRAFFLLHNEPLPLRDRRKIKQKGPGQWLLMNPHEMVFAFQMHIKKIWKTYEK